MTNESKWAARITAWRASGQTAGRFCADKDYSEGSLRYWASKLRDVDPVRTEVRIAKVVPATMPADAETPIVLEVAGVRVALRRGFDRQVLRDVLDALGSRSA